jgi:nucleotide-binding universal stress UspA family protein
MNPYLVALDSSPRAPHVLAAAVALAKARSNRLILFRAVGVLADLPVEAYAMPPEGVIDLLEQRAKRELTAAARAIPDGVPFDTRVDVGAPWQAICEAGKDTGAALIIIGSHGYSALDRLLGTTAARVVNHADRSVMVVRQPELLGRS